MNEEVKKIKSKIEEINEQIDECPLEDLKLLRELCAEKQKWVALYNIALEKARNTFTI
ncbi:MAG TPA: hypothetical protein PLP73_01180 [Candidatus Absconditabacterales bacterium]|nr:hypothetical protein [Candidatus Absconditabacterales bacterium]